MDNKEKENLRKKIDRLIRRKVLKGKSIVLFGAAAASKEVKTCLLERGISIDAVIDNDVRKIGRECMGKTVYKPEDMLSPFNNACAVLVCSSGYYREIVYQLKKLGYQENKHIFRLNIKTKETLSAFFYQGWLIKSGFAAYKRLTRNCSDNCTVFIAPYTGTGDIYLAGLFFFEYLRRHHITDYIFVVVSGACRKVAQTFGIKNVEVVKRVKVDNMINCERAMRTEWPIVILNDCWAAEYTNLLQWVRGFKGLSFDKMFRYFVFDMNDDVPYQLPPAADYEAQIDRLFEQYGLVPGKTVVLSPYSNTLFELPDDFWKAIVDDCKQKGYMVCTNCAGKDEPTVDGTIPVFFPLGQAIAFMNRAGCFIGVRSGLCDIISSSSCKKIILFEKDGFFYRCSPYDYFSLQKMGLCSDAIELEYRSDIGNEVLKQIVNAL